MKKMIVFGLVGLLLPLILYAQEKIEAPVWTVGDKWVFSHGVVREVTETDQNSYTVKGGFGRADKEYSAVVFEKGTLKRLYAFEGNKRYKYISLFKIGFNFPLSIGKTWKDRVASSSSPSTNLTYFSENYAVLGWEDVMVKAGKFRTVKVEYRATLESGNVSGKSWYWYSPDAKFLVKHQFEDSRIWGPADDHELVSFELKK